MPFSPDYVRIVLNENFEDAKTLFLDPLMSIHYAHLVMLHDTGIVTTSDARAIRRAEMRGPPRPALRIAPRFRDEHSQ